jgi:hypothetical protein
MKEKTNNISNFETSPIEAREIKKGPGVPHEIMAKRLDHCARQEGLIDGYFSSEEEIQRVLDEAGFKVEGLPVPLSVKLNMYLQEKYGDYIWREYDPNHSHDEE